MEHHLPEQPHDVVLVVERLDGLHVHLVAIDLLVDVARVGLLNHGGVSEHCRAEIAGGRRAEDRTVVAGLRKHRERARVVDVRMGKDDGTEFTRVDPERLVLFDRFAAPTLK